MTTSREGLGFCPLNAHLGPGKFSLWNLKRVCTMFWSVIARIAFLTPQTDDLIRQTERAAE
jgi:hypothetical protein